MQASRKRHHLSELPSRTKPTSNTTTITTIPNFPHQQHPELSSSPPQSTTILSGMATTIYKLTASLKGHDDDVRDVAFTSPDSVVSVSRDSTVRLWQRGPSPTQFDDHINSTGAAFVNSVAYIAPTPDHPKGLIVSGGQDTVIDVREPGTQNPDPSYVLLGHAHNVCSLDTFGEVIISGSWDGTARVWRNWETQFVLEGHEGAVWAVMAVSETEFITGGADKTIRLWKGTKCVKVLKDHTDCVRGLCRLPNGLFASCANDATIRIWSADGDELQQLYGHTNYIYSIAALPSGEIISSGEDRTVRIWKDGDCVQTITHPAISVWSVDACAETGDIATGASDNIVRVFSRDGKKWATEELLKEFDDSVAKSSIPSNQVGDVDKGKLPGIEALQKSGSKDGQVIMVRNGEVVEAHMWSASAQSWANVGQVVDAMGSNRKRVYEGKEYDFVFDVDIQEGAPALKLPYNASENPFDAARKFLEKNELPLSYLDTVGNFIVENSKGATIGQQPEPDTSTYDPWGSGNRYIPGQPDSSSRPPPTHAKVLPQKEYLSILTANLPLVEKKTRQLNDQLVQEGKTEIAMGAGDLETLQALCSVLADKNKAPSLSAAGLQLLEKLISNWPRQHLIPVLDLLRLSAGASPLVAKMDLVSVFHDFGTISQESPNNAMLAVRAFVNLFQTEEGRQYAMEAFEQILKMATTVNIAGNRNLKIAQATLMLNYSVLIHAHKSIDAAVTLLEVVTKGASTEIDSETVYRYLVAMGTVLALGGEVKEAANGIFDVRGAMKSAAGRVKEARVNRLIKEIEQLV
ncbi:WD40-repeat-containing domain protein [Tricharina praecox]|uniref:WD40-repeat-containing domain protein n=1 Tax=Tricharina praecox TaxID=43433 RepID=UPI00221FEC69|nr:WD40-repeat-containing domain protein [Tricharina praecox]KAI5856478.1 WD40-repeat-containing domain protein [Tricharina praecox]